MFDFYPGLPHINLMIATHREDKLMAAVGKATLEKQVGCFKHRVVTLVADKLETQKFTLIWKTN